MALCAGVGGLELGLKIAIPEYRCVCYVEREAYPAAILVSRIQEGHLDEAPIWDDIQTFDGRPWRGIVDIISAGFPCQPWSSAGRRNGADDERWLWPEIQRIIRQMGPDYVFLENVPGLLSGGIHIVLSDLAELGFNAEWDLFSAKGVGAPHLRRRVFILANSMRPRGQQIPRGAYENEGQYARGPKEHNYQSLSSGPDVANPNNGGRHEGFIDIFQGEQNTNWSHPRSESNHQNWWEVEPRLGRVANGVAHRVDRLRAIGNGVVPIVAAVAFRELSRRL